MCLSVCLWFVRRFAFTTVPDQVVATVIKILIYIMQRLRGSIVIYINIVSIQATYVYAYLCHSNDLILHKSLSLA